jgi:uncharacterized protein (TIGR03083 family)
MSWTAPPTLPEVMTALLRSHDQLRGLLDGASEQLVTQGSYADDWTVAQVASHLGSGAECFALFIDAGLDQTAPPGLEQFQPIWDAWNAKSPAEQASDGVAADAALLAKVGSLPPSAAQAWQLDMFGTVQNLSGLMRMRLAEHALHTWDIAVALDPAATVSSDAAGLVLGQLPTLVERVARPATTDLSVGVVTTEPSARLLLELSADSARLVPGDAQSATELTLPAESFVRLIYGRLDPAHTPASVVSDDATLDALRAAFPGF